jgi:hypothetical protein
MADIPVSGYQSFWTNTRSALKSEYHSLIGQFPDADAQLKKLFKVLGDIEGVAAYTPAAVGNSEQWSAIVNSAENRQNLCKALSGKTLFSALYVSMTLCSPEQSDMKYTRMPRYITIFPRIFEEETENILKNE